MKGTRNISILYFLNSFSIKRDLLYFDKFIVESENLKRSSLIGEILSKSVCDPSGNLFKKNMHEIEVLEKYGLVEFYKPIIPKSCNDCMNIVRRDEFSKFLNAITNLEIELSELFDKLFKLQDKYHDLFGNILKKSVLLADYYSIFTSFLLNFNDNETIPIVENYNSLNITNNRVAEVTNITINNFPYINVSTSIESLVDFKSDSEIKHNLNALKCAIYDMSKNTYSINEAKDKIEY